MTNWAEITGTAAVVVVVGIFAWLIDRIIRRDDRG